MKKSFNKLSPETTIEDLEKSLSPKNKEYISKYLKSIEGYVATTRQKKYRYSLVRFANLIEKDFDKLNYEEVKIAGGIINQSPFSNKTKQDIIAEIKTAFKQIFGKGQYLPECVAGLKAPTSKSKLKLPEDMPTEEKVYSMVKACQNSRDKFFVALIGLDGGLRPIEARNIKWGDIKKDKHSHYVTINTAKKSGDKETRVVRIIKSEPYFIKWTQDYPAEKEDNNFVFVNLSDLKQLTQGSITSLFKRLSNKLGMKLYPYLLRHQFITRASKNPEWSIPLLKKFIGHSLASNTIAEYQHFGDEDLKDAQLKINGIIKKEEKQVVERKPIKCPKCNSPNEYDSEFCNFCNMALTQKRMVEVKEAWDKNNKLAFEQLKKEVIMELEARGMIKK